MNKHVIIPRESYEETTFAVVKFAGCDESELLAKLRQAIKLWADTEESQAALEEASGDFNVGDVAQHTPAGMGHEDGLSRCLPDAGISHLDIDVYSQDRVVRGWAFDTRLA
jgi:hypothetical protein